MKSTFARAIVGFVALTLALSFMSFSALWAVEKYAGDWSWLGVIVILLALVTEVGIYQSTLSDPVRDWIAQPERDRLHREKMEKADTNSI